jgi:hypothetical protein
MRRTEFWTMCGGVGHAGKPTLKMTTVNDEEDPVVNNAAVVVNLAADEVKGRRGRGYAAAAPRCSGTSRGPEGPPRMTIVGPEDSGRRPPAGSFDGERTWVRYCDPPPAADRSCYNGAPVRTLHLCARHFCGQNAPDHRTLSRRIPLNTWDHAPFSCHAPPTHCAGLCRNVAGKRSFACAPLQQRWLSLVRGAHPVIANWIEMTRRVLGSADR